MGSSPLYLAIVVVWLIVLIPMLMRRDASDPAPAPLRRAEAPETSDTDEDQNPVADDGAEDDSEDDGAAPDRPLPPPRPHAGRARIIARRRRRTAGLTALLVLTSVAVVLGLGPWWVLAPPGLLLSGHLVLLREAAKADAERRAAELRRRRAAEIRARRAAAAREAEIVELMSRRDQVYDQYTDAHLRAAGD